ncbi:hypothetical protein HMPREF9372_3476 [Sporosarcina newyorkensis 2681]|uniref:Uncharacterized protein n=1 Tax=Sporosarcina newyorkensis 2681 TaxID=1027292 RepID=F9DXE5_9BACL|nr:hypothetical protein HMPREF9372_3476 [Sporosarcina newyorkensis 2681]
MIAEEHQDGNCSKIEAVNQPLAILARQPGFPLIHRDLTEIIVRNPILIRTSANK